MPDMDEGDPQDLAEAFDETHREGEDPDLFDAEDELDPDLDSRAFDVTHERQDDEDEFDDEDDDDFDLDQDADADMLLADEAENEPDLTLVADIDAVVGARGHSPERYESKGPLSDEQIRALGYGPRDEDPAPPQSEKTQREKTQSEKAQSEKAHEDERLDEGLEESFPASDPPAVHRPD